MEWTKLMEVMNEYCKNKKSMVILWENGMSARCKSITGAFETDNGLDMDEDGYSEYYAATVDVLEILKLPKTEIFNDNFIEISALDEPSEIQDEDSTLIWSRV